ncbi:O-methylsterigmatocystin oxidoreductase [Trametes elegans]|nr:O-methylsterigmatocystin oxidoreductase [Trametes elegans]
MPTKRLGPALRDMSQIYGDLMYLNLFGQPFVVINSREAAAGILEGHSANTASRPRCVMAELVGYMWLLAFQGYSRTWRQRRQAFDKFFHPHVVTKYRNVHRRSTLRFLQRLLDAPEDYEALSRHALGYTIMDVVYGVRISEESSSLLHVAENASSVFSEIVVPGRFLVQALPFLKYLPTWLPGIGFKRLAALWYDDVQALRTVPYDISEAVRADGNAHPCIISNLHERAAEKGGITAQDIDVHRDVAGIAYLTGADTSVYSLYTFFLAMMQYPGAQRRAQEELDAVVGPGRLPDFSDRESLPYVSATVKEVFRWLSIAPLGIWHNAIEEDLYGGFRIPAGCILVPNVWAMSKDSEQFPNPDDFLPERYLKDGKLDANASASLRFLFGFGRGICPGRHFAEESLFLNVASLLHVFKIEPPLDAAENPDMARPEIELDLFLSYPKSLKCRITPRSAEAEALIRDSPFVTAY